MRSIQLNRDWYFGEGVVVGDDINPWKDENGIQYIGIEQFLLDDKAIDM